MCCVEISVWNKSKHDKFFCESMLFTEKKTFSVKMLKNSYEIQLWRFLSKLGFLVYWFSWTCCQLFDWGHHSYGPKCFYTQIYYYFFNSLWSYTYDTIHSSSNADFAIGPPLFIAMYKQYRTYFTLYLY